MARNFSAQISVDGKQMLAIILPQLRKDGMYYEVNISQFPRFYVHWTQLGRYDVVKGENRIPYNVVLAVSDIIEEMLKKNR